MSYFEIDIQKIAASCPAKIYEEGRMYDRETIQASTLQEALEGLNQKIPVSLESGSNSYRERGFEVGKVYSFWKTSYSRSHGEVNTWEQWWIEVKKVEEETVTPENWLSQQEVGVAE